MARSKRSAGNSSGSPSARPTAPLPPCPSTSWSKALTVRSCSTPKPDCNSSTCRRGMGFCESRVAIELANMPQTIIACYATLSLAAQSVMTNPLYTPRELEHQWKDAGCRVAVVTDFLFESRIRPARAHLPIEQYIVASIPDYMRLPLRFVARWKLGRADPPRVARVAPEPGVASFVKLIRSKPQPSSVPPRPDDLAVLQYTGGAMGVPKGAMLTHANLSANLQQCRQVRVRQHRAFR